jgi:hypothetical protein
MIDSVLDAVIRPVALHWLSHSRASWRSLPSPKPNDSVTATGSDPDRVLLVGGGISVGWGMGSHDDALAGHLARAISSATGRGVVMDVVTEDILSDRAELPAEVTRILRTVDAVILTPGDLDSILCLPAATYRRRLASVLDQLTNAGPANLRIFIVATAPLHSVIPLSGVARWLSSRITGRLDLTAQKVCDARTNAIFVQFSPRRIAGRTGTGRTYSAWAGLIAPSVARQLDSCTDRSIR